MFENYPVRIDKFAERHFIKSFEKKYKTLWDVTLRAIVAELERIDSLLKTDRAETICDGGGIKIIKTKFKVAKSKDSAKSSGNRCIVAWHTRNHFVSVLLVYAKTDLDGGDETKAWKNLVKENYPTYSEML